MGPITYSLCHKPIIGPLMWPGHHPTEAFRFFLKMVFRFQIFGL